MGGHRHSPFRVLEPARPASEAASTSASSPWNSAVLSWGVMLPSARCTECQHCADADGHLHSFEESVMRMCQFMKHQTPGLSDAEAEQRTLAYKRNMPAWRERPELKAKLDSRRDG
jgi:hypothetical protein